MGNLNKVFLMGNLTRDPEIRYTQTGMAVTQIGLAINRRIRDSGTDQWREETDFINVTAFARRGEIVSEYFRKGDPILIEGRLKYNSWETPQGEKRSKLDVIMDNFEFISRSGGGTGGGGGGGGGGGSTQGSQGALGPSRAPQDSRPPSGPPPGQSGGPPQEPAQAPPAQAPPAQAPPAQAPPAQAPPAQAPPAQEEMPPFDDSSFADDEVPF